MGGQMTLIDSRSIQEEKKGRAHVCVRNLKNNPPPKNAEQNNGKFCVVTIAQQEMKLICN